MADLGERIHALVEWTAPPIDGYEITRGGSAPATPRWVAGLVAAVLVLVVGAFTFVFGVWEPGDPVAGETTVPVSVTDPVVVDDPATSVSTVVDEQPIRELTPVRVDCTAELEAFPCAALVDTDPQTEWQAPDGGGGVILRFFFAEPVTIDSIGFGNLRDDIRFGRNHRIRTMEVGLNDLSRVTFVELPDSNDDLHRIQVRSFATSVVTITITGTYPGVRVGDLEPFRELALADVLFFGRAAPEDGTNGALPAPTEETLEGLGLELCGFSSNGVAASSRYCDADGNTAFSMAMAFMTENPTTVDEDAPMADTEFLTLSDGSIALLWVTDESDLPCEIEPIGTVPCSPDRQSLLHLTLSFEADGHAVALSSDVREGWRGLDRDQLMEIANSMIS